MLEGDNRFSHFQVDVRDPSISVVRLGSMASCNLSVLIEYARLAGQLGETQRSLGAVNRYFELQAAGLIGRAKPLFMLARLCEGGKLPLSEMDLRKKKNATALAELSGALLCVVTDREVWVTPQGESFYQKVLQHQNIESSRKA